MSADGDYGPLRTPWRQGPMPGLRVRVLATPEDGGGSGVVEVEMAPGATMPTHTHGAAEVLIRVLAGDGRLRGAAGPVDLRRDGVVRVAVGVPVALENVGQASLCLLVILSPAGFERAFAAWPEVDAPAEAA